MTTCSESWEPQLFNPEMVTLEWSNTVAEWATGLLSVPMLTAVAARQAHGEETYGAVLCRVLETKCVHTLNAIVAAIPNIWDADDQDSLLVVRAIEMIEERGDNLLGQSMGLAAA